MSVFSGFNQPFDRKYETLCGISQKELEMFFKEQIKEFDLRRNKFLLDYPNDEVKRGFLSVIASSYFNTKRSVNSWIDDAVYQLEEGKIE